MMTEQQLELNLCGGYFAPCETHYFSTNTASNDGHYSPIVSINTPVAITCLSEYTSLFACNDQLYLPFNLIKTDKTLLLAPSGVLAKRNLMIKGNSSYIVERLLNGFATSHDAPKRLQREKYHTALNCLLANVLNAHRKGGQVLIETCTSHIADKLKNPLRITTRTTNRLLKFLADQNWITLVIGKGNEFEKALSWFVALPRLIRHIERSKITLASHTPHIELRDKNRQLIPWPKTRAVLQRVAKLERGMGQYNDLLVEHSFELDGVEFVPFARRIFNYSYELGGRFYAPYSNYKKEDRLRITIDGAETIEQDYKSLHFNLLYSMTGTLLETDPYLVDGYARNTVKKISFVLLNSENLTALARNITRSGNPSVKETANRYRARQSQYERSKAAGLRATAPRKPLALEGFIDGIPNGTQGKALIDALLARHRPIAHLLGTRNIGLRLQNLDSKIMSACIEQAVSQNIPVLSVHDSIISQRKDRGIIYGIMRSTYRAYTGRQIEISDC